MIAETIVVYYTTTEPLHEILLKAKAGEEVIIYEYEVSLEAARVIQKRLGVNDMRTPDVKALKAYIRNEFTQFIVDDSIGKEIRFKIIKRD